MMKRPDEIISDAEIEMVHANANFGSMTKRDVVDEGVLKCAVGYTTSHTMMTILREHGLIRVSSSYSSTLTKKGFKYLRTLFNLNLINILMSLRVCAPQPESAVIDIDGIVAAAVRAENEACASLAMSYETTIVAQVRCTDVVLYAEKLLNQAYKAREDYGATAICHVLPLLPNPPIPSLSAQIRARQTKESS